MVTPFDVQMILEHFDLHADWCDQGSECHPNCCHNPGFVASMEEIRDELRAWHGIADSLYNLVLVSCDREAPGMADLVIAFSNAKANRSNL